MTTYREVALGGEDIGRSRAIKLANYGHVIRALAPGARIVEIGPGNAPLLQSYLEVPVSQVLFFDTDPGVLAALAATDRVAVRAADEHFQYVDDLPDASVALVVLCHVLEHLPPDQGRELLAKLRRKLGAGGVVLVELPNIAAPLIGSGLFWSDVTHRTPYTSRSLAQLARFCGYAVAEMRAMKPPKSPVAAPSWIKWILVDSLGRLFNFLGGTNVIRSGSFFAVLSAADPGAGSAHDCGA